MASRGSSRKQARKESPDLPELLVLELQEIHSAENQLSRILPRLAKAVESETLRTMLEERMAEGETLIEEIEAALEEMDESPGRKKNVAAEGLINDAREHVQEIQAGPALDAVLIAAMQKTEHYCIAAWGTAKALAEAAGQKTVVRAMERALEEGKAVDQRLTELAESELMPALLAAGSEQSAEDEGAEDGEMRSGRGRKRASSERRAST